MPSNVYITFPATTEYIAPANGYIKVSGAGTASGGCIRIVEGNWEAGQTAYNKDVDWFAGATMPCVRGKVYTVLASYVSLSYCAFYYTVGEAKRLGLL